MVEICYYLLNVCEDNFYSSLLRLLKYLTYTLLIKFFTYLHIYIPIALWRNFPEILYKMLFYISNRFLLKIFWKIHKNYKSKERNPKYNSIMERYLNLSK